MAVSGPWADAGVRPGVQVWRVENFRPVLQTDSKQLGKFYTGLLLRLSLALSCEGSAHRTKCLKVPGDSYVVLHTVATAAAYSTYSVHFWLGAKSTQVRFATFKVANPNVGDKGHPHSNLQLPFSTITCSAGRGWRCDDPGDRA